MSKKTISRRQILHLALASPVIALAPRLLFANQGLDQATLANAPSQVVASNGSTATQVKLMRNRRGSIWRSHLVNEGKNAVRIKEVVLFELELTLPITTRLYGEGFQMLSQTGGTLGQPSDLGNFANSLLKVGSG